MDAFKRKLKARIAWLSAAILLSLPPILYCSSVILVVLAPFGLWEEFATGTFAGLPQ